MKYRNGQKQLMLLFIAVCMAFMAFGSQALSQFEQAVEQLKTVDWGQGHQVMDLIDAYIRDAGQDRDRQLQLEKALIPVLHGDATFVAKQFVCRKLMLIGSSQSIPVLADLLTDERLSHMARYALENIKDPEVNTILIETLPKVDGALKAGIINSLGKRGTGFKQIAPLVDSPDEQVAAAAVAALGKIGTDESARMLLGKLEHTSGKTYLDIVDALLDTAEKSRNAGNVLLAENIYRKLYQAEGKEHVQMAGFIGLIETDPKGRDDLIDQALKSSNPSFNLVAGRYLSDASNKSMLQEHVNSIESLPSAGQIAVLDAVDQQKYTQALKKVRKLTNSSDENVRIAALDVLGMIGASSDVSLLAEKLSSPNDMEKQTAQRALVRLTGPKVEPELLNQLERADSATKIGILEVLILRKSQIAPDHVIDMVDNEDATVQSAAYELIAALGTIDHLPQLISNLKTAPDSRSFRNAEKAMAEISKRYPQESLTMLLKESQTAEGESYYALMRVMASTNLPQALETIVNALKADDVDIRITAIKILSNWPELSVLDELFYVAKSDPESKCRILAYRGFIRLIKQMDIPAQEKLSRLIQVIDIAERDSEKMLAITSLGSINSIESLQKIETYLNNENMKDEVALAIHNVCELLQNDYPKECMKTLKAALENVDETTLTAKKIKELLDRIEMYQGRLLAEWDFSQDPGPWVAENDINLSIQDGDLKIEPTGNDPFMSAQLNLRGGEMDIQLKVKSQKTTTWQIFWGSSTKELAAAPLWIANFEVPPSEQEWQTVSVPIFVDGSLTSLRIDPGAGSDQIFIESIRVILSENAPAAGTVGFNPAARTRILLIGTDLDHPFGSHMYMHECGLLAKCLKQVEGVDAVVSKGWPEDENLLEDIDAIALYSSPGAEILLTGDHADKFRQLMHKGVGLACLHWSTGIGDANNKELEQEYLSYLGGIFSFAFSGLDMVQTQVDQHHPDHAVCSGWLNYDQYDEIYLRTKLLKASVPQMSVNVKGTDEVVAWTYERPDSNGGRSYGNTLGHFHDNFWIVSFRRSLVNGILWAANHEVPGEGAVCLISPEDMILKQP